MHSEVIPFPNPEPKELPDGMVLEFKKEQDGPVLVLIWASKQKENGYMIECENWPLARGVAREVEEVAYELAAKKLGRPG